MAIYKAFHKVEIKPAGSWVEITDAVIRARGDLVLNGNRDNALAFGDSAEATCTVEVQDTSTIAGHAWENIPIRVEFSINATARKAFVGIIRRRGRSSSAAAFTFGCEGFIRLIEETKPYSTLFVDRPCFTKTHAASIEDPADPSYAAGLGNFILWKSGGRPVEQSFIPAYAAAAKFWYSCDHAQGIPRNGWVAGDNGYEQLLQLARVAGGQVYQAPDGVVTYRQPFSYADSGGGFEFDEDVYGEATEDASAEQLATKVICHYIPREIRPMQEVANDTTPRYVEAGAPVTITLEPKWPIYRYELTPEGTIAPELISIGAMNGQQVPTSGYTQTLEIAAARVVLTITNTLGHPFTVESVKLRGEPLVAGEASSVTVGTGDIERILDQSDLIQDPDHAEMIAGMVLDFYASKRPIIKLTGCVFDPLRFVGERVLFTRIAWGVALQPCLILSIEHDDTGATANYELVSVADLPKTGDFFVVGTTDYTGQTKMIGY